VLIPVAIEQQPSSDWVNVVKQANQSVTGTAMTNDDALFFQTTAGVMYELDFILLYSNAAGATPDMKFDLGEDATIRGQAGGVVISTADAAAQFAVATNQTAVAVGTNAAERAAQFTGYHRGNGGVFRVRFAQNVNNATATVMIAGSTVRYRVVQ